MELTRKSILAVMMSCTIAMSSSITGVFAQSSDQIAVNGTHSSGSELWQDMDESYFVSGDGNSDTDIVIDSSIKYQQYKGIGISLDETGVSNLWKLDETEREKVIEKLVSPTNGAGLDHFRITIGSPDCIEHIPFWSYDDMPKGEEDWNLEHFSIQKDIDAHIIDAIHLIQKYNPDAQFFASAWSAPGWMTTTDTFTGKLSYDAATKIYTNESALRDDCIDVFARYYAKFIKAYEEQGIKVSAITELNEPGMDVIYPSMNLSVEQQQKLAIAIKKVFKEEGIDTELWMHDFNFWDWKYPDEPESTGYKNHYNVFNGELGAETKAAADGIGFHPYWGDESMMLEANQETGLPVYLTEAGGMDPGTILSYFRLNCSSYNGWTQITDQNGGSLHWVEDKWRLFVDANDVEAWTEIGNQPGAKWRGRLVTVNTNNKTASFNNSVLSGLGHFAKYLDDGDQRIYSSGTQDGISNVVYESDAGEYVMVVNNTGSAKTVDIHMAGKTASVELERGFSTLTWTMEKESSDDNHAPTIAQLETQNIKQFETANIQLNAQDADQDALTYYGLDVPSGMTVNPTTGLITWTPGTSGEYDVVIAVTDGKARSELTFKINVESSPVPLPNRIDANIKNIKDGDQATYQINAKEAGVYMVELNYSTNNIWSINGQKIALSVDGQKIDEKNLAVTWSGNGAVIVPLSLTAGIHDLTLDFSKDSYSLNYMNIYEKPVVAIPGKVEAEDYTNSFGVNQEPRGNRYTVSETNTGDWLEYTVNVNKTDKYTLALNSASETGNAAADIYVDDVKVESLTSKTTGDWGTYVTQDASGEFELTKGQHTIKIMFTEVNNGTNIDYLEFTSTGVEVVEKDDLEKTITEADGLDLGQYISIGKEEFSAALQNAKDVLANNDATQEDVNTAVNRLSAAIAQLVQKADKTSLNQAIEQAKAIDLTQYKDEGQENFKNALEEAEKVSNNEDALYSDVVLATENLINAQNALIRKTDEGNKPDTGEDNKGEDNKDNNNQTNNNQNINTSENTNKTSNQPANTQKTKTGDETNIYGYVTLLLVSLGALIIFKRKQLNK